MRTNLLILAPIAIFVAAVALADNVAGKPAADPVRDQPNETRAEETPEQERERRYKKHKYRHDDDAGKPPKFSNPAATDAATPPPSGRN